MSENRNSARVLEIGCGDGRDAKEIIQRAAWYLGMDVSDNLLTIARKVCPEAQFVQDDITKFTFPDNIDIIFSFASLLHVNKYEMKQILGKAYKALNPGGVFYISLKYLPLYTEKVQEDRFGKRQFFFYTPELIMQLAGNTYECVYVDRQHLNNTDWFTIVLKKPN